MSYEVKVLKKVQKSLVDLHPEIYLRVKDALKTLALNPKPQGSLKLSGRSGYRMRVGDYRIIYEVDETEKLITVLDVGHRSNIYK